MTRKSRTSLTWNKTKNKNNNTMEPLRDKGRENTSSLWRIFGDYRVESLGLDGTLVVLRASTFFKIIPEMIQAIDLRKVKKTIILSLMFSRSAPWWLLAAAPAERHTSPVLCGFRVKGVGLWTLNTECGLTVYGSKNNTHSFLSTLQKTFIKRLSHRQQPHNV